MARVKEQIVEIQPIKVRIVPPTVIYIKKGVEI